MIVSRMATLLVLVSTLVLQAAASQPPPPGHGKPLGEHNDLKTPAAEEDYTTITSKYLYEKYVKTRTPVILRGLAKTFPAFNLWTDEYIVENYGDMEVRLEAKAEKEWYVNVGDAGLGRASFREFFSRYTTDNMYCVSEVPGPMYKDIELPALMNCGTMKDSLVEMNLWINSGGAKSIIHKDAHNQLNCLLAGSKDWIFINNKYNDGIYQAEEIDGDQGGFSLVNPDKVNYITFPKFAEVPWEYATVNAGDCLFLPPRYYHRVKSTDRNFAVSFLFGTKSEFDMSGCEKPTTPLPLEKATIEWKYPGHGMMSMGNSSPRYFKEDFLRVFLEMTDGDITASVPIDEYIEYMLDESEEMPYIRPHLSQLLEKEKILGEVENVDMNLLELQTGEVWSKLAAAYSYDPSNDPNNEYYHMFKEDVVNVLKDATYYGAIDKESFVKAYSKLQGSPRVGRELFGKLSKDGTTVSWYDVNDNDSVFDVYGKDHDRGDEEMSNRNQEIRDKADRDMAKSMEQFKTEL